MEIMPNVSFWTIVNFLLLLVILRIFAWKPILSIIEKREKKIQDSIDKTVEAQEEAEKKLEEHKKLLEKGKKESVEIITQAKDKANKLQKEMFKKAELEAKKLIENARNEITLESEKAVEEIKIKVADISVSIASKFIKESISPEEHREFINNAIKEFGEKNIN